MRPFPTAFFSRSSGRTGDRIGRFLLATGDDRAFTLITGLGPFIHAGTQ
ncbi:MAG: hypothetical protein HY299_01430 [Verrucomicrobia bacterium]|nr:hypothetical protein [Verrucomicrobiota bacterium]